MPTLAPPRVWVIPTITWISTAPFVLWSLARVLGLERGTPLVQLMAFTPYVAAAAVVPAVVAVALRQWPVAGVAGVACLTLAVCVLPRAFGSPSMMDGVLVTVMSVNLLEGGAAAETVVDIVRERQVDILTVQELTPQAEQRLAEAGLTGLLPHHANRAVPDTRGSGLYARYPLSDTGTTRNVGGFFQVHATVEVTGAGPVQVESVHPLAPAVPGTTDAWRQDLRGQRPATTGGPPRILAGDFNSTVDHAELRRLLATGYTDAASAVGAGLTPTWPFYGERVAVTPKVALDHVLVDRRVGVRGFSAVTIPRSDHRAVVADLTLPR